MASHNTEALQKSYKPENIVRHFWILICTFLEYSTQLLLSVLLLILSPLIIIGSLPFFITRNAVKVLAMIFRKDLCSMIPLRSSLFATDKITLSPKCNAVAAIVIEGALDIETFRSILNDRLFKSLPKDPEGNDRYKEIFQFVVQWGGYFFWKTDESFQNENHIKSVGDDKEWTEEDLNALAETYIGRKWPSKRPTWEMILIPKYLPTYSLSTKQHSVILLAIHHSIGDGYSFLYFFVNAICQKDSPVNVVPNYPKRSLPCMLLYYVSFPFRASWEIAGIAVKCIQTFAIRADEPYDKYRLTGPEGTNLNVQTTFSLPTSLIKDVKSQYKMSFAAVQFSVLAGVLRDFQIKKGMVIPQITPCLCVVPYPGHKLYQLRNHMGAVVVNLPTFEKDPIKRLSLAQNEYNRLNRSTLPILSFYGLGLMGFLPSPIIRFLTKRHPIPTGLSSFPGGLEYVSLLDYRGIEIFIYAGMMEGNAGICFVSVSYVDRFRITITGKESIFSTRDLKVISKLLEEKFNSLHKGIRSDV